LSPRLEELANLRPLLGSEIRAVAADASAWKRLVLGYERSGRGHGVRDCGAATETRCQRVLLGALDRSNLSNVAILGDACSPRSDHSNGANLRERSLAGLVRASSGHEIEDESRTRDPHESATLVAAFDEDELVGRGHFALEDTGEQELVVPRKPVQEL
jgi:hypothetical protein